VVFAAETPCDYDCDDAADECQADDAGDCLLNLSQLAPRQQ